MIELEPLGITTASLDRLQSAMQNEIRTFRTGESARTLLNNLQIASRVGAANATVATGDGEAIGFVTIRFDREYHVGNIRLLYVVPGSPPEVGPLLVDHAVRSVWAETAVKYLNATLFIDQPGIREAFEARGAQCIPRQEMQTRDLSVYAESISPPFGFRFAPLTEAAIKVAAPLSVEAYRGTLDDLLFADLQNVEGVSQYMRGLMTNSRNGTFDAQATTLVYQGDTLAGLILCTITDENLGYISEVSVSPAFRRQGVARAMLSNALHVFHQKGAKGAQLWVTLSNPARLLYESLGFRAHSSMWVYVVSRDNG